ncbi:unnamed protein product, partial [Adineta ricciae]
MDRSEYDKVPTHDEQTESISKKTIMDRAHQLSWCSIAFTRNRLKIICTALVLVIAVAVSIGFFAFSQPLSNDQDDTVLQLRSYVGNKRRPTTNNLGYMNIYIDQDNRRPYQRFRFPVARYSRRDNPLRGPFFSFLPSVPIFADRLSKQTIIYSSSGVYIIPPVINMYGQVFSVAQLIASGYASLVSSGSALTGNIDMLRYFNPIPLIGPGIPVLNPTKGGFSGGMHGNFGSFHKTQDYEATAEGDYSQETQEDGYDGDEEEDEGERSYYRSPYNSRRTTKKARQTSKYTSTTLASHHVVNVLAQNNDTIDIENSHTCRSPMLNLTATGSSTVNNVCSLNQLNIKAKGKATIMAMPSSCPQTAEIHAAGAARVKNVCAMDLMKIDIEDKSVVSMDPSSPCPKMATVTVNNTSEIENLCASDHLDVMIFQANKITFNSTTSCPKVSAFYMKSVDSVSDLCASEEMSLISAQMEKISINSATACPQKVVLDAQDITEVSNLCASEHMDITAVGIGSVTVNSSGVCPEKVLLSVQSAQDIKNICASEEMYIATDRLGLLSIDSAAACPKKTFLAAR